VSSGIPGFVRRLLVVFFVFETRAGRAAAPDEHHRRTLRAAQAVHEYAVHHARGPRPQLLDAAQARQFPVQARQRFLDQVFGLVDVPGPAIGMSDRAGARAHASQVEFRSRVVTHPGDKDIAPGARGACPASSAPQVRHGAGKAHRVFLSGHDGHVDRRRETDGVVELGIVLPAAQVKARVYGPAGTNASRKRYACGVVEFTAVPASGGAALPDKSSGTTLAPVNR
jgi:hypothetical protein